MARPLLSLLLAALLCFGDEVVLKSGAHLSGELLEDLPARVTLRMAHGVMEIPRGKVERVVRETTGDYLLREGEARLRAGQASTAVELFARALAEDADNPAFLGAMRRALLAQAEAERGEFRLDAARAILRRVTELAPVGSEAAEISRRIERDEMRNGELHETAMLAFERGEFEEGLNALDAWRLHRPLGDVEARESLALAHVAACRNAAGKGNLRSALDHARTALYFGAGEEARKDLFLLAPVAILEAAATGDLSAARDELARIKGRYPEPAVPLFLGALVHHLLAEVPEAVEGYTQAARLADQDKTPHGGIPYGVVRGYAIATLRGTIARPPTDGVLHWRETFLSPLARDDSSPNFTVYAPSERFAGEVAAAADAAYLAAARDLLGTPPAAGKAEIVVHGDRQAYLAADPSPGGDPLAGIVLAREETGGVTYDTVDEKGAGLIRIELFLGLEGLLSDAIPHECVHVAQRRGFRAFRRAHWLDEGLAMLYESGEGRKGREGWLGQAPQLMPLPVFLSVESTPPGQGVLFYCQASVFTDFLRHLGDEAAWKTFLDLFATRDFEGAAREAWKIDSLEALERLWLRRAGR